MQILKHTCMSVVAAINIGVMGGNIVPLIIILSLVFLRTVIVGCLQDILH